MQVVKPQGAQPCLSSSMRLLWNSICYPFCTSWIGIKEARKHVAFGLVILFFTYFFLEFYLFLLVNDTPAELHLPIYANTSTSPCHASPYCVITSKCLFQGAVDFYVHKPLSVLANEAFSVQSYVSANFVSALHILAALISAKLIANDSLTVRRMGVLVYEVRNFLDSLDGVIAKEEHRVQGKLHLYSHPTGTWGYFVDGISDGFGCIFLLVACLIYMQRHSHIRKAQLKFYMPLTITSSTRSSLPLCHSTFHKKKNNESDDDSNNFEAHTFAQKFGLGFSPASCLQKCLSKFRITAAGVPAFHFLTQLFISSIFWNRNILVYGSVLEPGSKTTPESPNLVARNIVAGKMIHSPFMWVIIFCWRICNPLFVTDLLLVSIFLDRMQEFLCFFQYTGYLVISIVAAASEVHRWSEIVL